MQIFPVIRPQGSTISYSFKCPLPPSLLLSHIIRTWPSLPLRFLYLPLQFYGLFFYSKSYNCISYNFTKFGETSSYVDMDAHVLARQTKFNKQYLCDLGFVLGGALRIDRQIDRCKKRVLYVVIIKFFRTSKNLAYKIHQLIFKLC